MLIIAKTLLQSFVSSFDELGGPLKWIPDDQNVVDRSNIRGVVLGGTDGDWAFIFDWDDCDISMMYGTLVKVSGRLQTEIMSFTFVENNSHIDFMYASHGAIQRVFFQRPCVFSMAYSAGVPLPSEELVPIDRPDGIGLNAILASIGFSRMDFTVGFHHRAVDRFLTWDGDLLAEWKTPFPEDIRDHVAQHPPLTPPPELTLRFRLEDRDDSPAEDT